MPKDMMRIAMLISGSGTTALSIYQSSVSGILAGWVNPVLVIASKKNAGGIAKLIEAGMPERDVITIRKRDHKPDGVYDEKSFGEAIIAACKARGVDLIGQYGWMPLTPRIVIDEYQGRMINQHLGPVDGARPGFGGDGWYGSRVPCARIHFVIKTNRDFWSEVIAQQVAPKFDEGPVLLKRVIPFLDSELDPKISLEERTVAWQKRCITIEHEVQIQALFETAQGTIKEYPARSTPLVREQDIPVWEESFELAKNLFPHG